MHFSAARRVIVARLWLVVIAVVLVAPAVQATSSETGVFTGVLGIDHYDDFVHAVSSDVAVLDTGQDRLILQDAQIAGLAEGTRVSISGTRIGDQLLADPGAAVTVLAAPQLSAAATSASTAGGATDLRLAILLVNFVPPPPPTPTPSPTPSATAMPSDSPAPTDSPPPSDVPSDSPSPTATPTASPTATPTPMPTSTPAPTATPVPTPTPTPPPQPWTADYVRGVYFDNAQSVASYYADISAGSISISGDVFGYYTLAVDTSDCTPVAWGNAARNAATAAGVDLSAYTNVVYAFPRQSACWWGGFSNLPGSNSWINGSMSLYVTSHELGHNLGANHASTQTCTSGGQRVAFSTDCTRDEYGDPFDVMGFHGQRWMDNFHLWQIGVLSGADVQNVSASGTYQVAPLESPGAWPRIVRIPRGPGNYYYLEFRQPDPPWDDFSPDAAVVNGVSIRIAPGVGSLSQSRLLDTSPQTSGFGDAPLAVGQLFADDVNDIFVVTRSVGAAGASVLIHVGPDIDPPSVPQNLAASVSNTTVSLNWAASSDDVYVSAYKVTRDGTSLGKVANISLVDTGLAQGRSYTYSVNAIDESGNASAPAQLTVFLPDTHAPSAPGTLTATQGAAGGVALAWDAASDNVGVAGYRVTRDGTLIGTTAGTTYLDEAPVEGTATYAVSAYDAAGNVGPAVSTSTVLADTVPPTLTGPLQFSLSQSGRVTLDWPAATDNVAVSGYEVARDGVVVGTPTGTSFRDTGTAVTDTYDYRVVALDGAGNRSEPLSGSVYVADIAPPSAPSSTAAVADGLRSVALSWAAASDNVGVDHYLVYLDGALQASTRALSVTGLTAADGFTHQLAVRAVDAAGNVGPPGSAQVTLPDVTDPSAPGALSLSTPAAGTVVVSWGAASDNVGVASYLVKRDGARIATVDGSARSFTDTGVTSDQHRYAVRAIDAAGNMGPAVSASVSLVAIDTQPPSVPTDLAATAGHRRQVTLSWSPSTDDQSATITYKVFRGRRRIATTTDTSFVDRTPRLKTYRYRVRAVDESGNRSPFTSWVSATSRR